MMDDSMAPAAARPPSATPGGALPDAPVRVALWCWARRGGAANHTFELARALAKEPGIDLSLCIARRCDRYDDLVGIGVPVLAAETYGSLAGIAASAWRLPVAAFEFARFLRKRKVEVVLCSFTHLWNPFLIPAIRTCGARFVLTVHDGLAHTGDRMAPPQWWLDAEMRAADETITLTRHVRSQVIDRLGVPAERISVIPPGPYVAAAGGTFSQRLFPPRRLLFFGRIWPYKGVDLLLDAYGPLKAEFPEISLKIVGSGDFAPYEAQARTLPDVTAEIGYVAEERVPEVLAEADILVLPYREATQSGLVSLAQAVGLPLVATPVGGLQEQVVHGETGMLATAASPEALAEAIRPLLCDPGLYGRLGAAIHASATSSWADAAAATAQLLHRTRNAKQR